MTSLNDVHAWLNSPAGHAYQAECGGYSAALSALITANQRETSAAYEFNQASGSATGRMRARVGRADGRPPPRRPEPGRVHRCGEGQVP